MSYTVAYNPDSHIVEIKFQGDVTLNEVKELYSESLRVAMEQRCFLFLSDYREATIKLSTLEIYDLPKTFSAIFIPSGFPTGKIKRALVVAKDLQDYHFFETVTANSMQNTKIFRDVAEAIEWLSIQ